MRPLIRRYPAAAYFTLAFALSWGGILVVLRGGPIPAPPDEAQRLFTPVYLAMLVGPSFAGLAMTAITGGIPALRDYRARLLKWRIAFGWYAVALLTAPLALLITLVTLGQFSADFTPALFGSGVIDPAGPIQAESAMKLLVLGIAVGIGAGFFEELGWTGFAIPTLLRRHGAVWTGVVLGIVWGAWHFLAVWWGSASAFGSVPVSLFLLVALFTFLPPYRVLMVRVYQRTGSLLVCILMHASLTASMIILGPPVKGADTLVYDLSFACALWAIAGVVFALDHVRAVRSKKPAALSAAGLLR